MTFCDASYLAQPFYNTATVYSDASDSVNFFYDHFLQHLSPNWWILAKHPSSLFSAITSFLTFEIVYWPYGRHLLSITVG